VKISSSHKPYYHILFEYEIFRMVSARLLTSILTAQDIDRKNEQTAAIVKRQADQILELENLYKEEQILRKRYFNMMEGLLLLNADYIFPKCTYTCFILRNYRGSLHAFSVLDLKSLAL
jgi:hypothetical protein